MTVDAHPTPHRLAAFVRGQLPPAELAAVEAHVADCDVCRAALVSLPDAGPDGNARPSAGGDGAVAQPAPAAAGPRELADHPRYKVIRRIGVGGMGLVYLAEHKLMGRLVALKVMARKYTANPAAVERFRREVRAAARLAHPNIVTAYDADEAGGLHFLVMEYVDGVSLDRIVARRGPQPVAGACHVIRLAALGLEHAFEKGMVHRDVKPHNLMVTRKGTVKILDFGLARLAQDVDAPFGDATAPPAAPGVTSPSLVMGTPDYLAPEQARNSHAVDIRADVYALGCTLYFLLAGKPPFHASGTAFEKMLAHTRETPPPIKAVRPDVPDDLAAVLDRMMAKNSADRFSTPAEVAQALLPFTKAGQVLDAEPLTAPVMTPLPVVTAVPAPFAFDAGPVGPTTESAAATEPSPVKRPRRKKRKAKTNWLPWVMIGVGLAVAVAVAVFGVAAAKSLIKPPADKNEASHAAAALGEKAKPEPAAPAATPAAPMKAARRVVIVVPSKGLFYQEYGPVRERLAGAGVEVVTASTRLEECEFAPGSERVRVKPDRLVTDVKASDFDAVVFVGQDTTEYTTRPFLPAYNAAERLISEMKGKKVVAAICTAQYVLFKHNAVRGEEVAESKQVAQRRLIESSGAKPVPKRVVVTRDKVITAGEPADAGKFADAILAALSK